MSKTKSNYLKSCPKEQSYIIWAVTHIITQHIGISITNNHHHLRSSSKRMYILDFVVKEFLKATSSDGFDFCQQYDVVISWIWSFEAQKKIGPQTSYLSSTPILDFFLCKKWRSKKNLPIFLANFQFFAKIFGKFFLCVMKKFANIFGKKPKICQKFWQIFFSLVWNLFWLSEI